MTRNTILNAAISATLAQRRHAEAVQALERTKQRGDAKARGDTQAMHRAMRRLEAATQRALLAEVRAQKVLHD